MPIRCLFGSREAPPFIDIHPLEALLLTVDPAEQKLLPKETHLL